MIRMKTRSCRIVKVTDNIRRGGIAIENEPSLLQSSGKGDINTCNSINMLYRLRKEGSLALEKHCAKWRPCSLPPCSSKDVPSPQGLEIGKAG